MGLGPILKLGINKGSVFGSLLPPRLPLTLAVVRTGPTWASWSRAHCDWSVTPPSLSGLLVKWGDDWVVVRITLGNNPCKVPRTAPAQSKHSINVHS